MSSARTSCARQLQFQLKTWVLGPTDANRPAGKRSKNHVRGMNLSPAQVSYCQSSRILRTFAQKQAKIPPSLHSLNFISVASRGFWEFYRYHPFINAPLTAQYVHRGYQIDRGFAIKFKVINAEGNLVITTCFIVTTPTLVRKRLSWRLCKYIQRACHRLFPHYYHHHRRR